MKRSRDESSLEINEKQAARVIEGVGNFFFAFSGPRSHFRGDCVKMMFGDWVTSGEVGNADLRAIATIVGKDITYVRSVCQGDFKAPELFQQSQPIGVTRPRALAIKTNMANFIIDEFDATPSGSVRPRFAVQRSFLNGYQKWAAQGQGGSYNMFLDVCHQLHVRMRLAMNFPAPIVLVRISGSCDWKNSRSRRSPLQPFAGKWQSWREICSCWAITKRSHVPCVLEIAPF